MEFSIQPSMRIDDVEQHLPKRPNFALVFGLAGAAILVFFGLALVFLHYDVRHVMFHHTGSHPTSRLLYPVAARSSVRLA
jgi:hypothetical protein